MGVVAVMTASGGDKEREVVAMGVMVLILGGDKDNKRCDDGANNESEAVVMVALVVMTAVMATV